MQGSVGELFVEFSLAGYDELATAITQLHGGLGGLAAQVSGVGTQLGGLGGQTSGIAEATASLWDFAKQVGQVGEQTGSLGAQLAGLNTLGDTKLEASLVSVAGNAETLGEQLRGLAADAARLDAQPASRRSAEDLAQLSQRASQLRGALTSLAQQIAVLGTAGQGQVGASLQAAAQNVAGLGRQVASVAPIPAQMAQQGTPVVQPATPAQPAPPARPAPPGTPPVSLPIPGPQAPGGAPSQPPQPPQGQAQQQNTPWHHSPFWGADNVPKLRAAGQAARDGAKTTEAAGESASKGLEQWSAAIGGLASKLAGAKIGAAMVGVTGTVATLADGVAHLGRAILPATASLKMWAIAGVMASGSGQILSYQFQEIGRQIASVFAPQVKWLIEQGQRLITWFQRLNGEQQTGLRNWLLLAGGISAMGLAVPAVAMAIGSVVKAFQLFQTALVASRAAVIALNLTWLATPIGMIVTGIAVTLAAIVASTTEWEDVMGTLAQAGKQIAGPFEGILQIVKAIVAEMRQLIGLKPQQQGDTWTQWMAQNRDRARVLAGDLETKEGEKDNRSNLWRGVQRLHASTTANAMSGIMGLFVNDKDMLQRLREQGRLGAEARQELAPRMGGFEQIDAAYQRIAEASLKATGVMEKTAQEKTNDLLQRLVDSMPVITDAASRVRPFSTR